MSGKTVVEAKGWATSWTVIFNALGVLAISGNEIVAAITESGLFGSEVTKWLVLIVTIGNIVLRKRTRVPLASTPFKPQAAQAPAPPTYSMNVTGGAGT